MFTGIITAVGRVTANERTSSGAQALSVLAPYAGVEIGESIAVNGVCLTVTQTAESVSGLRLHFFVSAETCDRANLGGLGVGAIVNLERALAAGERLSGHIVQGHVDGRASISRIEKNGEAHLIWVQVPRCLDRYLVEKGSVALDGISLTVNSIHDSEACLTIIPHTWQQTNLRTKQAGQDLNLEVDMIAKYVEKLTNAYHPRSH